MATYVIVGLLGLILISLLSAMVFLVKDRGQTDRTVKALTWRISLSATLVAVLLIGLGTGWLQP